MSPGGSHRLRRRVDAQPNAARDAALHRVRGESGIALVLSLGILLTLSVMLTSTIAVTSASGRQASQRNAGQQAYALAEAGINQAVSVLYTHYPGTAAYPGDATVLPPRTTTFDGGGSVTWSGNLCNNRGSTTACPGPTDSVWRDEWRITAAASIPSPTAPGGTIRRTVTAIVPIVMPATEPATDSSPLNFLYSGTDMTFRNSVGIGSPVYATRDLHLESTAVIKGAAQRMAVGRDLYLKNPQNQIGSTGGSDPRLGEIHVVNHCSSKANPTLHACGPSTAQWDADTVFATVHDDTIPVGFLDYVPTLTCCAPYGGAIAPIGSLTESSMGFWYRNADLGPLAPCTTKTGSPPVFDTASGVADDSINWSATPTTAINLTPTSSYTCRSVAGSTILGELSWNAATRLLTVKGTIFIDGSIYIAPSGTARYTGQATIVASGTFGMKNSTICASYAGACDFTPTTPWDPNTAALIIVADGAAGAGAGQGQGSDFNAGEGIELKGSDFQGALIANKTIRVETTSQMQGPMLSVYNELSAGQSNDMTFPAIYFAPSGGGAIVTDPPPPQLLEPRNFGGG